MILLGNALKFTGENGSVDLCLKVLPCDGERVLYEIRVRDSGIGMSPEFVEDLFTPFERERTSTVSRIQGTGLGMAITKNILDMMGGEIRVETEKGKGTEFTITVSFPEAEPPEEQAAGAADSVQFDGLRILLVEDNPVNMEIAQMLLAEAGFLVDTAENGRIAVDTVINCGADPYDVILMDIQMPEMDGYTACREIRSLGDSSLSGIPIIAMTANEFSDDIKRAADAGMNGHIAKPIDIPSMMSTLSSVLSPRSEEPEQRS